MPDIWIYFIGSITLIFSIILIVIIRQWKNAKSKSIIFLSQIESILDKTHPYTKLTQYLEKSTYKMLLEHLDSLNETIPFFVDEVLRGNTIYKEFKTILKKWRKLTFQFDLSQDFISSKLTQPDIKEFFDSFNNVSLDKEQRTAVVTDENAALIVAAAGSGKTLTIAAKVAYLVKFQNIDPEKILLITFTDKAAKEMERRVSRALNRNVVSFTFHKLGLSILTEKLGYKPSIVKDEYLDGIINEYINNDLKNDKSNMIDFIELFAYYSQTYSDETEYESKSSYASDMRSTDLITLKSRLYLDKQERKTIHGERVKSLAELQIANFLFINGIEYIYEEKYKHDTATKYHRQYHPDFYLPQYELYIEHYGVDRQYQAKWLNRSEEIKYIRSMDWKRKVHEEYGTKCIETYSYMAQDGNLLAELERKLTAENVEFNVIDDQVLIEQLILLNTRYFKEFQKLIKTFILLLKESGRAEVDTELLLKELVSKNTANKYRARLFLKLITPIFDKYENHLRENHEIDFSDMINQAKNYLINHTYKIYDYVIVDEYQDISESKSQLIDAITKGNKTKLFCVGDDWQSIFRFAGSDIYQFTSFENRYKYSITQKIQRTYRNPQQLVNIASKFIMKNKSQISKEIISTREFKDPVHLYAQGEKPMIQTICEVINNILTIYEAHEILILGRYNFDLDNDELYQIRKQFVDIQIDFSTVHKAKGLEAEHIIIINNKNHVLGFPSKIADDEILTMVLSHQDEFAHSEERRLFYVGLTRAKYTCHLVVQSQASVFIEELKKGRYDVVLHELTIDEDYYPCPRCDGHLVKRSGPEDDFYGCSNYPYCEYSAPKNINLSERCPECNDYMIWKRGPYGAFWGCNSYNELKCSGKKIDR
ncbi:MAG: UvrD-helicase domain-containing protein [Acholeplasmataceae bacterium]|nr:UvrD-helicase domain-containing protein [Acholeplasmataceae bacterium]